MSTIMKALEKANREGGRASDGSWQQVLNNNSDVYAADSLKRRRQMRTLSQIVIGMGLIAGLSIALLVVLILWLLNDSGASRLNAFLSGAPTAPASQQDSNPGAVAAQDRQESDPLFQAVSRWNDEGRPSQPSPDFAPQTPARVLNSRILDSGAFESDPLMDWDFDDGYPEPILGTPDELAPPVGPGRAAAPPPPPANEPRQGAAAPPQEVIVEEPVDAPPAMPKLAGIMWTPQNPFAFIEGETVSVGEMVTGYKVLEITRHTVTVESPEGRKHILRP